MTEPDTSQQDYESEGEKLADELKQENNLHEENKKEENKRHENAVKEIRGKGGVQRIYEKSQQVSTHINNMKSLRNDIKQTFYEGLNKMTNTQHVTVLDKITVRENSVYKYDHTDEAPLRRLFDNPAVLTNLKQYIDENQVEDYEESLDVIRRMNMDFTSYSPVKFTALRENESNYIKYQSGKTNKYYIFPKSRFSREEAEEGKNSYRRTHSIKTSDPEELKKILRNKDEVEEAIEEVKKKALKEVKTREEAKKELNAIMKKQIMMGGLVE